jgi:hypothetical protein
MASAAAKSGMRLWLAKAAIAAWSVVIGYAMSPSIFINACARMSATTASSARQLPWMSAMAAKHTGYSG